MGHELLLYSYHDQHYIEMLFHVVIEDESTEEKHTLNNQSKKMLTSIRSPSSYPIFCTIIAEPNVAESNPVLN